MGGFYLNKGLYDPRVKGLCREMEEGYKWCSGPCKWNRDVVLVRRMFSSGKPRGVRNLEWGGSGEGMERGKVSFRVTWGQGGRDPIMPRRVSK
jgi:hypothetical protein